MSRRRVSVSWMGMASLRHKWDAFHPDKIVKCADANTFGLRRDRRGALQAPLHLRNVVVPCGPAEHLGYIQSVQYTVAPDSRRRF